MRFAAVGIAVCLLVALGAYDALRAKSLMAASGDAQAKINVIPLKIDDWTGEEKTYDPKLIAASGAVAHRYIRYTRSGAKPAFVDVLLLAGDPGDIGAHDPERCYGGSGHKSAGPRTRKQVADQGVTHSFWCERFQRETLPAGTVEVCWSWTADGPWVAADDARFDYASRGLLYKMYVSRTLSPGDEADDPAADLLKALAPLSRTALAGARN